MLNKSDTPSEERSRGVEKCLIFSPNPLPSFAWRVDLSHSDTVFLVRPETDFFKRPETGAKPGPLARDARLGVRSGNGATAAYNISPVGLSELRQRGLHLLNLSTAGTKTSKFGIYHFSWVRPCERSVSEATVGGMWGIGPLAPSLLFSRSCMDPRPFSTANFRSLFNSGR